ncbi:MAG: TatD family hydrolase [Candidatus Micrarchaeota archaeon]|nr:TatD family hydrolase [Candidatus Micrarchaeota archaeon]
MYQNTQSISKMRQETADLSDAHCHLNLFPDPKQTVSECAAHGMKVMLATGGSVKDNLQVSELTHAEIVFGIVGIGPDFVGEVGQVGIVADLVKRNRKIVGIGEIGLDFKIATGAEQIDRQKELFEKQIVMAKQLELPIVIHSRGSFGEVLKILDGHKVRRAMFHFFEGNGADAKELEGRGYLMSVPPVENSKRKDAIRSISLKNIVVETDSPVVGKSPLDVKRSLEMIAKIREMQVSELAQITTDNLREFFYI